MEHTAQKITTFQVIMDIRRNFFFKRVARCWSGLLKEGDGVTILEVFRNV